MNRNATFLTKLAGLGLTSVVRSWMGTLDFKAAYYDRHVDPCLPTCSRRGIYIFWHEYMPFLMYLRGHCDLAMLISRHRDADVLSRLSLHFGFDFVRGSTRRGGRSALRDLIRKSRTHHLTITPDGPRGPRRRLAAGCVYLASKLNMPIVAIGLGYDRPWRVNTWDRFAVPRPFSRARVVVGPYLHIPPAIDRDGIEAYRLQVQQLLQRLTLEAEAWAEAGTYKVNQVPLAPAPRPLPSAADRWLSHFRPVPHHQSHALGSEPRRAA